MAPDVINVNNVNNVNMSENKTYRYTLDPSSKKYICPECGKLRFVRYIDTESGATLSEEFGRCDREDKCGYHKNPYKNGYGGTRALLPYRLPVSEFEKRPLDQGYNNFATWLRRIFPNHANRVLSLYKVGTSIKMTGAIIFWQIDETGRIRTGKIMKYDHEGKRDKSGGYTTDWVHRNFINKKTHELDQCLFGLHQIYHDKESTIAIVESEKTAIICSIFLPQFLWMATGSLGDFKAKKLQVLSGRRIIAFPDQGGYDKWKRTAIDLGQEITGLKIKVEKIENLSPTSILENGADIADILLEQYSKGQISLPELPKKQIKSEVTPLETTQKEIKQAPIFKKESKPETPTNELDPRLIKIITYFDKIDLNLLDGLKLKKGEIIESGKKHVSTLINRAKNYNGRKLLEHQLIKLESLKLHLEQHLTTP